MDGERGITTATLTRGILIALVLGSIALLLWTGRNVLFLMFFGVLVGVYLSMFISRLERLGMHRVPALLVVLLANAAVATLFFMLLWPPLRDQLVMVARELPGAVEQAGSWIESQYRDLTALMGQPAAEFQNQIQERWMQQATAVLAGAVPIINTALGALAGGLIVLVLGIYLAANPDLYRRGFERLFPPGHRPRISRTLDETGHTLRRWIVGTLIAMVLVALLTGVGLSILGVPGVFALAALAGIFEFVPYVGPWLAAIPGILLALTVSPTTALWAALLYVVVQQIESNLITPLVMRGAVELPPALTVLFQIFMVVTFGFLGLLLAVPVLAATLVVVRIIYVEPMESEERSPPPLPGRRRLASGEAAPPARPRRI